MSKQLVVSLLIFVLLAAGLGPLPLVQAAPGDLDPAFGGFGAGGQVTVAGIAVGPNGLVPMPDGRILLAGSQGVSLRVKRYLSNGQVDRSFGDEGVAEHSHPQFGMTITSAALQPDGKIVLAGHTQTARTRVLITRLTAGGDVDISFGNSGFMTHDFGYGNGYANALAIQSDGRIIVGGQARIDLDDDFFAIRLTPNGRPDNTFNQDGVATIGFGGNDGANDLALLSDDRVLLVGGTETFFDTDFALALLDGNGSLDDGFDGDGKLSTGFGDLETAHTVVVQADDRVVVAGWGGGDTLLARYWPSGDLDGGFGPNATGKIRVTSDSVSDMVLQPDGKLLLLGEHANAAGSDFALHRLLANGLPDSTFDDNGRAFLDFETYDTGSVLALQADGRYLVLGSSGPDFFNRPNIRLLRLHSNLTYDLPGQETFALNASPRYSPGSNERAYGLALEYGGRLLVAGEVIRADSSESNALVTRFFPDGQVDGDFGTDGSAVFGWGQYDSLRAAVLQSDGNLIVAGYSDPFGALGPNFLVARVNTGVGFAGQLDSGFGFGGFNLIDFAGGPDYGHALALAPGGKIVVAGSVWDGQRYVWGVARLHNDGTPDNTFDDDGKVIIPFNHANSANAVAVQPDGKILVAGHVGYDFAVVRLNENGSTDYSFGPGSQGMIIHDMGGTDEITALVLTPGGWFYTAGSRALGEANVDFALAQYTETGRLTTCPGGICQNWGDGTLFVDFGGADEAFAIDFRSDNRLLAAGCSNGQFAWTQVRTGRLPSPIKYTTNFAGQYACAAGAKYVGADRVMLAGVQINNNDRNVALARFETTINLVQPTAPPTASPTATSTEGPTATPTVTETPSPTPTATATSPGNSSRYSLYLPVIAYGP
jgi:uncharacterized delta-60 repeat protein